MKRDRLVRIVATAALATAGLCGVMLARSPAGASPASSPDGQYIPLPAQRVLDTRKGAYSGFIGRGTLGPHATGSMPLSGQSGLPPVDDRGGTAVLNVTVTNATAPGYLTLLPWDGTSTVSSMNFTAHTTVASLVAMHYENLGADLFVHNASAGSADVIIDVEGYYTGIVPVAPGRFGAAGATRVYDSRSGAPLTAGATRSVTVAGHNDVPATGVGAALVDLIAVAPARTGYLAAYPDQGQRPATSNLNFAAGQNRSGMAIVPLGTDGKIDVYNGSRGSTNIVVDVFGYYLAGSPSSPGAEGIVPASRLLDTRSGNGAPRRPVGGGHSVTLQVLGRGRVPTRGVSTVALNVVATGATRSGYLSVRADGSSPTGTSLLNYTAGATISNLVIAPVGADGKVVLTVAGSGSVNLIADVQAYSLPATVLSGRVTNQVGKPVQIDIDAHDARHLYDWSTETDSQGRFTFGGVDGVALTLCFEDDQVAYASKFPGSVASQCWQGAPLGQPTTPITVAPGSTFTADAALPPGGAVSGTVTDGAGHPIQGDEEIASGSWSEDQTGQAGGYFLGGLSAGTYTICFRGAVQTGAPYGYAPQCYANQPSSSPTPFTVSAGKITSGIDQALVPAGAISGSVDVATSTGSTVPEQSFNVVLTGPVSGTYRDFIGGKYQIEFLPQGSYTVCVRQLADIYAVPGCYGSAGDTPAPVTSQALTSGIDLHLAGAGAIAGAVTDSTGAGIPGATITATSGTDSYTATTDDSSGLYTLGQLPPGQYTVCFHADGHTDQCYAGAPDAASATAVSVTMDFTTKNISAALS